MSNQLTTAESLAAKIGGRVETIACQLVLIFPDGDFAMLGTDQDFEVRVERRPPIFAELYHLGLIDAAEVRGRVAERGEGLKAEGRAANQRACRDILRSLYECLKAEFEGQPETSKENRPDA